MSTNSRYAKECNELDGDAITDKYTKSLGQQVLVARTCENGNDQTSALNMLCDVATEQIEEQSHDEKLKKSIRQLPLKNILKIKYPLRYQHAVSDHPRPVNKSYRTIRQIKSEVSNFLAVMCYGDNTILQSILPLTIYDSQNVSPIVSSI